MSNSLKSLFKLINGMSSLYIAPYHRNYVWDVDDCFALLDKAMSGGELDLGVITYQKTDDYGNYILIDGYQRLITVLLFVQAVIKTAKVKLADKNKPINFLMYRTDDEEVFKLKINNNDKNDIENIIKNNFNDVFFNNANFKVNYDFFVEFVSNKDIPILEFLNKIAGIKINNMILDNLTSDEEDMYCTINKSFTQVDVIRNFVYKDLKLTDNLHIFNTYWLGLEKDLNTLVTSFITDYLTIQNNGLIPQEDELFDTFSVFYKKLGKLKSSEDMIKHMYRYASFYAKITTADVVDEDLKNKLNIINSYGAKDTYPYLMEVFEDYEYAHINKNMLMDILNTIIMFIKERSSSENISYLVNFAQLSGDINRMLTLKDFTPRIIKQKFPDRVKDHSKLTINDLIKQQSTH